MIKPVKYRYNAIALDAHDGDTIHVVIDRGMYDYAGSMAHPVPYRLAGMAARELGMEGGLDAKLALQRLVPTGSHVILDTVKPDKYAPRWNGLLWYEDPDSKVMVSAASMMILNGWALTWDGSGAQPIPPWPRYS